MTVSPIFHTASLAEFAHGSALEAANVHLLYVPGERIANIENTRADTFERLQAILSDEERKRADEYLRAEDRRTSIVARGLLREALSRYCEIPARELRFTTIGNGKPALEDSSDSRRARASGHGIQFNISHSGGSVFLGFTRLAEVGVDIEAIDRNIDDLFGVAENFFAPGEAATLRKLQPAELRRGFLNCWTRKEAFIKVHGEGLGRDLNSFEVELRPTAIPRLLRLDGSEGAAADYTLIAADPDPQHIAAICLPARPAKVDAFAWNGDFTS